VSGAGHLHYFLLTDVVIALTGNVLRRLCLNLVKPILNKSLIRADLEELIIEHADLALYSVLSSKEVFAKRLDVRVLLVTKFPHFVP
jgi:hypothetical protein